MAEILTARLVKRIKERHENLTPSTLMTGKPYLDDVGRLLTALELVQKAVQKELRKDDTGKFNVTAEAQQRLSQALRDTGWEVTDGKD